jgi:hypothetical protein
MSILYLALGIYVAGVAIVLYVRPHVMFHPENGSWKEFGINTAHHTTIFPFWMFAILWAFMSYAIATIINVSLVSVASPSNNSMFYEPSVATPISQSPNESYLPARMHVATPYPRWVPPTDSVSSMSMNNSTPSVSSMNLPTPSVPSAVSTGNQQLPGYYIVEPQPSGVGGPRFVYFGPEPPTYQNLAAYTR